MSRSFEVCSDGVHRNVRFGLCFCERRRRSDESVVTVEGDSLTLQSPKDEVDINNILAKYAATGVMPSARASIGEFGDFSAVPSYMESLLAVQQAQSLFSDLPAKVRSRFDNDPGQFMSFMADDRNYDEALKLGLVEPKPASDADRLVGAIDGLKSHFGSSNETPDPAAKRGKRGSPAAGDGGTNS